MEERGKRKEKEKCTDGGSDFHQIEKKLSTGLGGSGGCRSIRYHGEQDFQLVQD